MISTPEPRRTRKRLKGRRAVKTPTPLLAMRERFPFYIPAGVGAWPSSYGGSARQKVLRQASYGALRWTGELGTRRPVVRSCTFGAVSLKEVTRSTYPVVNPKGYILDFRLPILLGLVASCAFSGRTLYKEVLNGVSRSLARAHPIVVHHLSFPLEESWLS